MGALLGPLIYSGLLGVTGNYGIGFILCAVPSLFVGINLLSSAAMFAAAGWSLRRFDKAG